MARRVLGWSRMNVSLYQAAAALDASTKWQQVIAENLAASSTPAFKKNEVSFSTIQAGMLGASDDPTKGGTPSLLPKPSFRTNFIQGSLRGTGSRTDLALNGDGFFAVRMPDGEVRYTRDGAFRLNLQGEMRNKDGHEFVAEGGNAAIIIPPRLKEDISVNPDGEITAGSVIRGKLSIFEFQDRSQLRRLGSGYFVPPEGVQAQPAEKTTVSQSQIEAANTLPTAEVSTLMQALRHYEANQRVIQMQDERMGRMIQELTVAT